MVKVMKQYIDKSALVAEIEKLLHKDKHSNEYISGKKYALIKILSFIDTLEVKEDVVSNDPLANSLEISRHGNSHNGGNGNLEEAASQYPSVICHISPQWKSEVENVFKAGAEWQKENFWKDAQGNDLPEIDREVIVLYQPYPCEENEYAVSFAHRPPERWYGRDLDGEEHVFEPKTYDKGEWNIPNVVWWLDLDLPIKGE